MKSTPGVEAKPSIDPLWPRWMLWLERPMERDSVNSVFMRCNASVSERVSSCAEGGGACCAKFTHQASPTVLAMTRDGTVLCSDLTLGLASRLFRRGYRAQGQLSQHWPELAPDKHRFPTRKAPAYRVRAIVPSASRRCAREWSSF
jgi:hypothetical protein